jgi:hypothetical protein
MGSKFQPALMLMFILDVLKRNSPYLWPNKLIVLCFPYFTDTFIIVRLLVDDRTFKSLG